MHPYTVHGRIVKSCDYCSWTVAVTVHEALETRAQKKKKVKRKCGCRISVCLDTTYFTENWKLKIIKNNFFIIYYCLALFIDLNHGYDQWTVHNTLV